MPPEGVTMPLVTGNLRDIANEPMGNKEPEILFSLNRANSAGGVLYPTQPVTVKPDNEGNFYVNLASTVDMVDTGYYQIQLRFLSPSSLESTLMDFPDWRITVPREGGTISTLLAGHNPGNQRMVWVSNTPPLMPRPNMMWLEQDPSDPNKGDGRLYEFRGGSWSVASGKGAWQYIAGLRGPAGYMATGAAEDQQAIADYIKGTAGPNPVKTAVESVLPTAKVNSQTFMPTANIVYKYNSSKKYRYEVVRVRTGGSFKPGILGKLYAKDFEKSGVRGDNFKVPNGVGESVQSFAARSGADIVFNSSGWDTAAGTGQYMIRGLQIKDGVMYRDFEQSYRGAHCIGVRADGTMAGYKVEDGWTGERVLADGVINTYGFGPLLVHNGVAQDIVSQTHWASLVTGISGRQILGHTSKGDIILITVVGVSSDFEGVGGNDISALAHAEGCYNAIMLDGGGSAQTMFNGFTTHPSSDSEGVRLVGDCGYIFARTTQTPDSSLTQGAEPIKLAGGIVAQGSLYTPAVVVRGGVVSMEGGVSPSGDGTTFPANTWITVGQLPDKARPKVPVGAGGFYAAALGASGEVGKVQIRAWGEMSVQLPVATSYVNLSAITYTAF